jgi:hypothetical protein
MPFTNDLFQYVTAVFLETGTYQGDTLERIRQQTNVPRIFSIELSDVFYANCQKRFQNEPRVSIIHGNSKTDLYDVIRDIDEPITFWLDGHWSGVADVGCDPEVMCPILQELEQISRHPIKSHVLMIDDMQLMGNHFPVEKEDIIAAVYKINPNYTIKMFHDTIYENNVLVAIVV